MGIEFGFEVFQFFSFLLFVFLWVISDAINDLTACQSVVMMGFAAPVGFDLHVFL